MNDASSSYPEWRDVVEGGTRVHLSPETPAHVRLEQDRGLMEYDDRGMRAVETFQVVAREIPRPRPDAPGRPASPDRPPASCSGQPGE